MLTNRLTSTLATVTCATLLLTACGGGESATPGEDGELVPVTVGSIPIIDTAAFQLGLSKGFFEEEGLDVQLTESQVGSTILSSVLSGDTNIGFSNLVSVIIAEDKGMPIEYFAPAVQASGNRQHDHGAVVVAADSPIRSPKSLEGKTVGVNALQNVGQIVTNSAVVRDGGDWTKVQYVEMNFSEMIPALESGELDAAWMVDPFVTMAENAGAKNISPVFVDFDPDLQMAGFFASTQYAKKNPQVLTAFADAIKKSNEYANENPDEARQILSTYTKIDPALQAKVSMPRWPTEVNMEGLQKFADAAFTYKMLTKEPQAENLFTAPGATE